MFGRPLPSSLATDLFLVQTSTSSSTKDGVGIVLVVRKTHAQSVHQLLAVQRGVGLTRPGVFSGSAKNVAWYAYRHRGTTAAGVAAAQKLLLGCLAVT
jgi:hypothetical protein